MEEKYIARQLFSASAAASDDVIGCTGRGSATSSSPNTHCGLIFRGVGGNFSRRSRSFDLPDSNVIAWHGTGVLSERPKFNLHFCRNNPLSLQLGVVSHIDPPDDCMASTPLGVDLGPRRARWDLEDDDNLLPIHHQVLRRHIRR